MLTDHLAVASAHPPAPATTFTPIAASSVVPGLSGAVSLPAGATFLKRLGQGAWGAVCLVDAPDLVPRPIALKVLANDVRDHDGARQRFARECALACRVVHPCLVRGIAAAPSDPTPWLAMEVVEGPGLETCQASRPKAPPLVVAAVGAHLAQALHVLHDAGWVHRDVKPANVRLHLPHARIHPVLVDLGMVREIDDPAGRDATLPGVTAASEMVGTPYYLSPEAVLGLTLDGRADLYALGLVLWELLAGTQPFGGRTALEIAVARVATRPPRLPTPSDATLADRLLLENLEAAICWMLEPERQDRPPDGHSIARVLATLVAQHPTDALWSAWEDWVAPRAVRDASLATANATTLADRVSLSELRVEPLERTNARTVENTASDSGVHGAVRLAPVRTVAEPATGREVEQVTEGFTRPLSIDPRFDLAQPGGVYERGLERIDPQQPACSSGVTTTVIPGADRARALALLSQQRVDEGGLASPRRAEQRDRAPSKQERAQCVDTVAGEHRQRQHGDLAEPCHD